MSTYGYDALYQLWLNAGGTTSTASMAAAIAMAESGGDTKAYSSTHDVGLWQINLDAHTEYDRASLEDPMTNARAALAISSRGTNWRPWCTAYSDGACGTRGGTYQGAGSPYQRYLGAGAATTGALYGAAAGGVPDLMGPEDRFRFGQPSLPGTGAPYEPFPSTVDRAPSLVTSPGRFGVGSNAVAGGVPDSSQATRGRVPTLAEPYAATAPVFAQNLPSIETAARQQTFYSDDEMSSGIQALDSLGP